MKKEQFEDFLTQHERRIYNYIWNLVRNEADAQDLTQITFLAFYEHIESIDAETSLAYLYRIAHNKSYSHLKKNSRFISKDPGDFNLMPAPKEYSEPDFSPLHAALAELPPKLSGVLHLQYFEKLSYKEISARLGISVKAVESLCVRAKKILRKKMMKEEAQAEV
ncbi:MAG: RNA polymerase sigma factor [Candidatus Cloacimonadota bacterium]